jgi:hypothetical protein
MTQAQLLSDLGVWGVNVAFVAAILFPFVVRTFWAWEKSDWGLNIVLLEILIAFALLPSWLRRAVGISLNTYFLGWLVVACLWGIAVVIVWRTIIIWRTQRYRIPENGDNGTNGTKEEEKIP